MRIPSSIAAALAATLVSACATAPPPRLYVLSSLSSPSTEPRQFALASAPESPSGAPAAQRRMPTTTIGIVPVTVAQYLDRPEIIVRRTSNELQILENDRWAEPVGSTATRALVENLSVLLSQSRVSTTPMRGSQRATYELSLDLTAFEVDEGGAAVLAGDWTLIDPATGAARAGGRLNKSIAVGREAGGDAIAAAMSRNLVEASQDIAREIAAVGTPPEAPRGRGRR
jgi:uncharacterized lipoprotein YmbA